VRYAISGGFAAPDCALAMEESASEAPANNNSLRRMSSNQ
jgi:hypothetical protein